MIVVTKPCEVCGSPIVYDRLRHTRWYRTRFCSKACAGVAHRTVPDQSCAHCGRIFRPRLAVRQFCSSECYDEWRKARPSSQDARMRGRNRARLWFAPRPCEVCGAMSRPELKGAAAMIQRHHRDGDQMNNDPSNIAFLCQPDHTEEHRGMRALGIGRKVGGPRPRIVALMHDRAVQSWTMASALLAQGMTYAEVAADFRVHPDTVRRWERKYS